MPTVAIAPAASPLTTRPAMKTSMLGATPHTAAPAIEPRVSQPTRLEALHLASSEPPSGIVTKDATRPAAAATP